MRAYHYQLLDVFTNQAFGGNQLAVFTDAEDLSSTTMQQFAKELNLAEITFVLPPQHAQNDFHIRIFTPAMELPMAGHPTVGTAYILAKMGLIALDESPKIVRFEEQVGVIEVSIQHKEGDIQQIQMHQPLPEFKTIFEDKEAFAELLSIDANSIRDDLPIQVVTTGVPFVFIPIRDLATMHQLKVRLDVWETLLKDTDSPHIFTFSLETETDDATVHSRMFAPAMGIPEDPATGAASGPLGAYMAKYNLVTDTRNILSEQGMEMGRSSFIYIDIGYEDGEFQHVVIGGACVHMGEGTLFLAE